MLHLIQILIDSILRIAAELAAVSAIRALPAYHKVTVADLPRLFPDDEFEEEMIVMADVRGYFQVAHKVRLIVIQSYDCDTALRLDGMQRIIDNVPQTVHRNFVEGFAKGLQAHLLVKLDMNGTDARQRIRQLLAEDPGVEALRAHLNERLRRLEDIRTRLNAFSP